MVDLEHPSPWAFRDLPAVTRLWCWLFLIVGGLCAARAFVDGGIGGRALGLGWIAVVAGVQAARHGLAARVCGAVVVAGNALLLSGLAMSWHRWWPMSLR